MIECLCVGLGGFVGSILRYLIGLIKFDNANSFPINTLIINVVGSFLIALIVCTLGKNSNVNPNLILFLKVGICGGFTTFSTFTFETTQLIQNGKIMFAILYVTLSLVLSLTAIFSCELIVK